MSGASRGACDVFGLSKRMLIVLGLLVLVIIVFVVQGQKSGSAQPAGASGCQMQVTADVLNVRASPADNAQVVGKLATGAIEAATSTVQNGYRKLADNRWVATKFLKQSSGTC